MNFADRVRKINKIKKVLKKYNVKTKEEALMFSSFENNKEFVELLINAGVDVNTKDNNGWTALMYASSKNSKEIVKLLFNNGANVNAKSNKGWTALMYASKHNDKEMIKLLKEYGAKE